MLGVLLSDCYVAACTWDNNKNTKTQKHGPQL
jgi:hypothetical protein